MSFYTTQKILNTKVLRLPPDDNIVKPTIRKSYSEESFLTTSNGPEFILKSGLPSRQLELCSGGGDTKAIKQCRNKFGELCKYMKSIYRI